MKKLVTIFSLFVLSCNSHRRYNITDGGFPFVTDNKLYSYAKKIGGYVEDGQAIVSVQWRQLSGPNTANIVCASCKTTDVTGLTLGEYQFEFSVTNSQGLTGRDTMKVTVMAPPLIVDFISFTGSKKEFYNSLEWSFGTTEDVMFDLESSFDGNNFNSIHKTKSNHSGTCTYKDYSLKAVTWYRVKQTDQQGKIVFSETIKIQNIPDRERLIISNPVQSQLQITFVSAAKQKAIVTVISAAGAIVMQRQMQAETGFNRIVDNVSGFAAGTYIVTVRTPTMMIAGRFIKLK